MEDDGFVHCLRVSFNVFNDMEIDVVSQPFEMFLLLKFGVELF